mgnify:CR=1 FL=1
MNLIASSALCRPSPTNGSIVHRCADQFYSARFVFRISSWAYFERVRSEYFGPVCGRGQRGLDGSGTIGALNVARGLGLAIDLGSIPGVFACDLHIREG